MGLANMTEYNVPFFTKRADSFSSRFKGLMFRKEPLKDEALWLLSCNSIHMFFMRFPIDVIFLDKQLCIVKTVEDIRPWSLVLPVRGAHSCLELPVGTVQKYKFKELDRLDIKDTYIVHHVR
jgi:uncharacterized membrane protein (UPF0127 family)